MDPLSLPDERLRRQLSTRQMVDAVWADFLKALDGLPAQTRVAFLMARVFEASLDEAAAVLHTDAATCRALVEHARAHIQAGGPRRARKPRTSP